MADGAGLENRYGETHRGFESHALRTITSSKNPVDLHVCGPTAYRKTEARLADRHPAPLGPDPPRSITRLARRSDPSDRLQIVTG